MDFVIDFKHGNVYKSKFESIIIWIKRDITIMSDEEVDLNAMIQSDRKRHRDER